MKASSIFALSACLMLGGVVMSACSDDNDETISPREIAEKHRLLGDYTAVITPTLMGNPLAEGEHNVTFEMNASGDSLRLRYTGFNAFFFEDDGKTLSTTSRMPFNMNVDVRMAIHRVGTDSLSFDNNKNGFWQAAPRSVTPVDPSQMPTGVTMPAGGATKGITTYQASVSGGWRNGVFTLEIKPNVMPQVIKLRTVKKNA